MIPLMILDLIFLNAAEYLAFITRFGYPIPETELKHFLSLWFIITVIRIWSLFSYNVFNTKFKGFLTVSNNIIKANIFSTILIVAITFFNRTFSYPRMVIFLSFFYSTIFFLILHYLYLKLFLIKKNKRNVLIIGATDAGKNIVKDKLFLKQYNLNIVGFIDDRQKVNKKVIYDFKVLGKLKNIKRIIGRYNINFIIIAVPNESAENKLRILAQIENLNLEYIIIPNFYEIVTGRAKIDDIEDFPVLINKPQKFNFSVKIIKRIFDIIFSFFFLLFSLPFFLLIAVLIKLDSRGPVFYKQLRAGMNGVPFYIYKFRTMVINADKLGPLETQKEDNRITRIGKFLRKFSLDELPQFYNVLKGDMSIVGPRPEVVEIVKKYKTWQRNVLQVRPGITGLAQISGRQELDIPTKLKIDLYYINNYSLLLDFEIIFKTIIKVIYGEGAY